ncbi:hypothetical protein [Yoonia sp. 2307UL14-13]|uniref:hypothetical protein n=1 Tax=Yoonia sp. 2307UL14-13 TaxID=3126506 RepID=UPI003099353E
MRLSPIILCGLTACTTFPVLDGTITDTARDAPYPQLGPIPTLTTPEAAVPDLSTRIAALNARAAQLRQTEIGALQ